MKKIILFIGLCFLSIGIFSQSTFRTGIRVADSFLPTTNGGVAIGSTTRQFSGAFLFTGGVINWDNGDLTLTHSANTITLGGGDMALGSNSLTLTGSISSTGSRVLKGWFTNLEITNLPTVNGGTFKTALSLTSADVGLNNLTNKAQVELEDSSAYPNGYMSRYDGISGLAGKQDNPINYAPTIINFGNTTQQYDITGTTWVASSDGTPNAVGHLLPATLVALGTAYDDEYLSIRENTGAASATNPLTVQFTFPSVATFNVIKFRTWYNGSASHQLTFELYNGVDWDAFITESNENAMQVHTAEVLVPAPYIIGGNVVGRFRHEQTGNAAHYLMIDFIVIASGGGEGGASIQTAFQTPSTATGTVAATNVQDAIAELETEKLNLSDSVNYTKGYMSRYDGVTGDAGKLAKADSGVWAGGYVTPQDLSLVAPAGGAVALADSVNYPSGYMSRYDGVTGLALKLNKADSALMAGGYTSYADGIAGLALKANLASPTFTGTVTIPTPFTIGATSVTANGTELNVLDNIPGTLTSTELGYVDGVTSAIQTQLNAITTELDDSISLETIVTLQSDSIPQFVFLGGGGNAGDTTAFTTSTVYGSYRVKDTTIITSINAVMIAGTTPQGTDTLGIQIYFNDSINVTTGGSVRLLNAATLGINSVTTGTVDASFANNTIYPGERVFCKSPGIVVGRKPIYFECTVYGYIRNRTY